MSLSVRILYPRLGSGNAKLFFTVAIGDGETYAMTVRDCVLRDGSKGPFVSYPSKLRTKRADNVNVNGSKQSVYVAQLDDAGKPIYDNIVDLYFDKVEGQEERKATPASWDLKEQIAKAAEASFQKLSGTQGGRGVAPAAAEGKSEFAGSTGAKKGGSSVFDEDDSEDLPF